MQRAESAARSFERLGLAIQALGLDLSETVEDLAALLEQHHRAGKLDPVARQLVLEWLGAQEQALPSNGRLSHRDLLQVIARSSAHEAVGSLTIAAASRVLQVTQTEISARIEHGALWAYDIGREPRLPKWQFIRYSMEEPPTTISTSMELITSALHAGAPPDFVRRLMTIENGALTTADGQILSPRRWLIQGRSPWPVAALLLNATGGDIDAAMDMRIAFLLTQGATT